MPKVHKQVAKNDIYSRGLRVPSEKTKSGMRLDRSQPADANDTIIVPKGSVYYWWKFRYGSKHISLTPPKPQQLTQSEFNIAILDIQDDLDAIGDLTTIEEVRDQVEEIKGRIEELRDEQEEKKSNMPDSLQESATGELLQERYDALDDWYNDLDGLDLDDADTSYEMVFDDEYGEISEYVTVDEAGSVKWNDEKPGDDEDFDREDYDLDAISVEIKEKYEEKISEYLAEKVEEIQSITCNI